MFVVCPKCGSGAISSQKWAGVIIYTCNRCDHVWTFDTLRAHTRRGALDRAGYAAAAKARRGR